MEWGDPREKPCRPHEWTTLAVGPVPEKVSPDNLACCAVCHVRRCASMDPSGRCTIAVHHPQGTYHRYPNLQSEPVSGRMLDPSKPKRNRKPDEPPPLEPV